MNENENVDPVQYAQNQLLPLIDELLKYSGKDGTSDQISYFLNIKNCLTMATNSGDLIEVFFNFPAANFMNFSYSETATLVLDKLLEKSMLLSQSQNAENKNFN